MQKENLIDIRRAVRESQSFPQLAQVALERLKRRGQEVSIVCGPITTGGTGTRQGNLEVFKAVIRALKSQKIELFNQMPYEPGLERLSQDWQKNGGTGYCQEILDEFFLPLFESSYITRAFFTHKWWTSTGAKWEHDVCFRLGLKVVYLHRAEMSSLLRSSHPPKQVREIMSRVLAA